MRPKSSVTKGSIDYFFRTGEEGIIFDPILVNSSEEMCEELISLSSSVPATRKFLADLRDYAKRAYINHGETYAYVVANAHAIFYYARHLLKDFPLDLCSWEENISAFFDGVVKNDLANVVTTGLSGCFDKNSTQIAAPEFLSSQKAVSALRPFNIGDQNDKGETSMFSWVFLTGHLSLIMSMYLNAIGDLTQFADELNSNGYKPQQKECVQKLGKQKLTQIWLNSYR